MQVVLKKQIIFWAFLHELKLLKMQKSKYTFKCFNFKFNWHHQEYLRI